MKRIKTRKVNKTKYYFFDIDSEICYELAYIKDLIKQQGLKSKEVYKAEKVKDDFYIYCKEIGEAGEKGYCGKNCKHYEARNGKWGICKHQGDLYEHGDKILIEI